MALGHWQDTTYFIHDILTHTHIDTHRKHADPISRILRTLAAFVNAESLVASRAADIHLHKPRTNTSQVCPYLSHFLLRNIHRCFQLELITFRMSGGCTVRDNFMCFVANERGWVDAVV